MLFRLDVRIKANGEWTNSFFLIDAPTWRQAWKETRPHGLEKIGGAEVIEFSITLLKETHGANLPSNIDFPSAQ